MILESWLHLATSLKGSWSVGHILGYGRILGVFRNEDPSLQSTKRMISKKGDKYRKQCCQKKKKSHRRVTKNRAVEINVTQDQYTKQNENWDF